MVKIAAIGGKIIGYAGKVGLYPSCCCKQQPCEEQSGCCCFNLNTTLNFQLSINCGGGEEQFSGTLGNEGPGIGQDDTGRVNISVMCTTFQNAAAYCPPGDNSTTFVGYVTSIIVDNVCGGTALHPCAGVYNETIGLIDCPSQSPANFTANIFKCNPYTIIGSITISPP